MTRNNAEHAQRANALAGATRGASDSGAAAMERMTGAMEKIRASAEGTAAIIRDINEIAFQTNLLALNAAVEAARAGEAGRGFAVVAEEVRSLALRSKEAARKTEVLIRDSVQIAQDGEGISRQVNANLEEIVGAVGKVSAVVGEIAKASDEQARGISQVNQAVAQIDKVTQQNAASSEESASAAEELAGQAQELATLVQRFQLSRDDGPRTAARARTPAAPRGLAGDPPRAGSRERRRNGVGRPAGQMFPLDGYATLRDF
jgi:methyl-accepting chemotaxis protein